MKNIQSISQTAVALVVCLLVYFATFFFLAAVFGILGLLHGDDSNQLLLKDGISPMIAGYVAFSKVDNLFELVKLPIILSLFLATVTILAVVNLNFSWEWYLSQNRTSDWHLAIVSNIMATTASAIGALGYCRGLSAP